VPQERGVRTARGERRRQVLVRAAADLLLDEGLASLSHRAVAARAGLPLAATTYYFDSVEDLRDEALQAVAQGWLERAGAVVDALPTRIGPVQAARAVAGVVGTDAPSRQLLLRYERSLDAGRHERLRPLVVVSNARLCALVREVLLRAGLPAGQGEARLVLAVADGAAVTALAEGAAPDAAVRTALGRLLRLLQGQQAAAATAAGAPAAHP
jgi:DNA-binding transcriptional regulator YbjK